MNARRDLALRVLTYCLVGGLPLSVAALGAGGFNWWWLAGITLASAFLPVALYGPRGRAGQFAVIAPVLWIVTALCTWTEALVFMPDSPVGQDPLGTLAPALVLYSLLAGGLALLGPGLRLSRSSAPPVPRRRLPVIVSMLLLSGLAYVLYYQVTGSITFQYFTRDYYPEAVHQVLELGVWFWVIQFGRGTAMALVVVPFIYTLRMSRRATALLTGLLLWVAGGLAPLLAPNDLMTPMQRFIHVVELLTQLAPLGITAALLLRPRSARAAPTAALLTSPQSNTR